MRSIVIATLMFAVMVTAPPVEKKKPKVPEEAHGEVPPDSDVSGWSDLEIEYKRYLQEVVSVLEADPKFRKKLEEAPAEDIRSGAVVQHLGLVDPKVRSQLDELKRQEVERLRHLAMQQYEQSQGIDKRHLKVPAHVDVTRHDSNGEDLMPDTQRHLQYEVYIPAHEVLTTAELRIRHHAFEPDYYCFNISTCEDKRLLHRINVYQVLDVDSGDRVRLLDTKTLDTREDGWVNLDVSPAVASWLKDPSSNYGLIVHLRIPRGMRKHFSNHMRLKREADPQTWSTEQLLLVTYTEDAPEQRTTQRRSFSKAKRRRKKNRKKGSRQLCQRQALFVDFQEVGWNDWIIAPVGYQAYYCQGECRYPLADHLNSTNHAIIQAITNSVDPTAVPQPCCVPTALAPMTMLYLNENDTVQLKKYRDMIVTACGCR